MIYIIQKHKNIKGKKNEECLKVLLDFTRSIIIKRNEEFESSSFDSNNKPHFLDMLLKAKLDNSLTLDDIQEEVDTFMFEGHDTTTAAACNLLFLFNFMNLKSIRQLVN